MHDYFCPSSTLGSKFVNLVRKEPQLQPFSTEPVRKWFNVAEKHFESVQIDNHHAMFNLVCAALDPAITKKGNGRHQDPAYER